MRSRAAFAETVDADNSAFQTDVFAPVIGNARLDCYARHATRQHGITVSLLLLIEHEVRRHRNDPHGNAFFRQRLLRIDGQSHFRTRSNNHGFGRTSTILEHIAALANRGNLSGITRLMRQVLTRQD